MKRIRRKIEERLDLIMPKYFFIIPCREQIKGSQITKRDFSDKFSLLFLFNIKQAYLKV